MVGDLIEQAVSTAANCDAAIVIVGTNDDWETEGRDREFMELPGKQPELIRRVCEANPNTVVVINSGSVVTTDWSNAAPAILQTWFGGQEMSHALVDVLTGEEEPGGRLPNSWPHRLEDTPAFVNYPGEAGVVNYGEGVFVGYRWYQARDIDVAYPFGHGLGYTTFEWGEATISGASTIKELEGGEKILISIPITNVGDRLGSETTQCYVSPLNPISLRPPQELKGFAKIKLQPGETTEALIELDYRSFAVFDPGDPDYESRNHRIPVAAGGHHIGHRSESGWFIDPGKFELKIGTSSTEICKVLPLDLSP
jgi:beta-glucosidase